MSKDNRKQIAYNYLRDAILNATLAPGTTIVEQDISDVLGISRTPVREALKIVEAEGLVRQIPSRGTFVTEISTQDIEEIFELRETIEILALRVAIHDITDNELANIDTLLCSLGPDSPPEDFYESDRNLHDLIIKHGHNRRLVLFLNNINSQVERLRHTSAQRPNRLPNSMKEHLAILEALKERNFNKAESTLKLHLTNVKLSTLDACKSLNSFSQNTADLCSKY